MKIAFYTLGCKVNQYETQSLREQFIKKGHTVTNHNEAFDIIIINSCTVTAESDRKTGQLLRRFRRENPNSVIVLTGCMAQVASDKAIKLLGADIVVGNSQTDKILQLVEEFLITKKPIIDIATHTREEQFSTLGISRFDERTRAYMKIEDGCDRYCSYCIIPYARGFVRSRSIDDICAEAKELSRNGYLEIVLVGINLSAYGKGENINICDAVEAVCEVDGIKRVRLGSLEPDHITDDMLTRLKAQPKFCPQFHLSLQSGCDRTLKRMNRHYDTAFYRDLIARIRSIFPDAAITTDIMVGFAGETEDDFKESLSFVREIGFAKAHVFTYSRRAGTVADRLPDQIPNAEKTKRSKLMLEAAACAEEAFLSQQKGKTLAVLFETFDGSIAEGYTENYSRVRVFSPVPLSGQIRNVLITDCFKEYVTGEVL